MRFLQLYQFDMSASFSAALYGVDLAQSLARYWCSKMGHWYQVWQSAGAGRHVFTNEEVSANGILADVDAARASALPSRAVRRIEQLVHIRPRLRPV